MPRRQSVTTVLQLDYFMNISFEMRHFAHSTEHFDVLRAVTTVIRAKVIRTHTHTQTHTN